MQDVAEWKKEFIEHRKLIMISLVFLVIALLLNFFAGRYVNRAGMAIVSDIILDHIPVVDLSFIFIYGYITVILVLLFHPLLTHVKEFHVTISQFSLLVMIRSFFISLTHLKAPVDAIIPNLPHFYNVLVFQNDLFFSGHTAIPFLGFLLYRREKIGIFFLVATVVLASTVLLMHLHYSIDVFAAFFIAYGSYKVGQILLKQLNHG